MMLWNTLPMFALAVPAATQTTHEAACRVTLGGFRTSVINGDYHKRGSDWMNSGRETYWSSTHFLYFSAGAQGDVWGVATDDTTPGEELSNWQKVQNGSQIGLAIMNNGRDILESSLVNFNFEYYGGSYTENTDGAVIELQPCQSASCAACSQGLVRDALQTDCLESAKELALDAVDEALTGMVVSADFAEMFNGDFGSVEHPDYASMTEEYATSLCNECSGHMIDAAWSVGDDACESSCSDTTETAISRSQMVFGDSVASAVDFACCHAVSRAFQTSPDNCGAAPSSSTSTSTTPSSPSPSPSSEGGAGDSEDGGASDSDGTVVREEEDEGAEDGGAPAPAHVPEVPADAATNGQEDMDTSGTIHAAHFLSLWIGPAALLSAGFVV